jgi:hypothetical protein
MPEWQPRYTAPEETPNQKRKTGGGHNPRLPFEERRAGKVKLMLADHV